MTLLTNYFTMPIPDASHSTLNTFVKSGSHMIEASIIFFISPNALVVAFVHLNSPCFMLSVMGDNGAKPFNQSTIKGSEPVKIKGSEPVKIANVWIFLARANL